MNRRRVLVVAAALLSIIWSGRTARLAASAAQAGPARGERVPDAGVKNGVPQGIFISRSLLTGRAVCLLFLSGGRVTRAIPTGGLERFDWAGHQAAHSGDAGRWQMAGEQLQIAWGDGGIHQGPLKTTADGIEFYGKRYARPVAVAVSALAGKWESARGTAVTGGPGVNITNTLLVQADGRYRWVSATGGVVSGRAVSDVDKARTGLIEISGATATFRAEDGTSASYTFLAAAGQPVVAFSLDANMFTRMN